MRRAECLPLLTSPDRTGSETASRPRSGAVVAPVRTISVLSQRAGRIPPPARFTPWQQQEARRRLLLLCDWLHARLDRPVRNVKGRPGVRSLVVFECIAFNVYEAQGGIAPSVLPSGRIPKQFDFEIGRPLRTDWWLWPVLEKLKLADTAQCDLLFAGATGEQLARWLADSAFRLVRRDARFRRLREHTLPAWFKLPADLLRIALFARPRPEGAFLNINELNRVLRHADAFRRVAREQPRLLPLLHALLERWPPGRPLVGVDAMRQIKALFIEEGVSQQAWRYLARHGARLFTALWCEARGQPLMKVAAPYLIALDFASLPPPPPPSVARALLHAFGRQSGMVAHVDTSFLSPVPSSMLRSGLIEADRLRQRGTLGDFAETLIDVCLAFSGRHDEIDRNQARAGWRWFLRRSRHWQDADMRDASGLPNTWSATLRAFEAGEFSVLPVESRGELLREAAGLRNCLANFHESCALALTEIYSLRDARTGKRRGCVALKRDDGRIALLDVKGFANAAPSAQMLHAAREIAGRAALAYRPAGQPTAQPTAQPAGRAGITSPAQGSSRLWGAIRRTTS